MEAATSIRSTAVAERAAGFSRRTGFPAHRARITTDSWEDGGVATTTASHELRSSPRSSVTGISEKPSTGALLALQIQETVRSREPAEVLR